MKVQEICIQLQGSWVSLPALRPGLGTAHLKVFGTVCRIRSPLTLATWAYIAGINGKMTEVSSVDK